MRRLTFHRPSELSKGMRDAMWAVVLLAVRGSREEFERGVNKMDEIWLLEVDGVVMGFGGVRLFHPEWRGRKCCVIFTGRVCLHPSVRGNSILQRIGFRYYMQRLKANPLRRIYWMFGAGSFKSYLLLPRNFHTYWPRPGAELPARERALLDAVAREFDDPLYRPGASVMSHPGLVYVDGGIGVNPDDLRDADVAFYARVNPGQPRGDDLVCLCPLTLANWAACLGRALLRAVRPCPRTLTSSTDSRS